MVDASMESLLERFKRAATSNRVDSSSSDAQSIQDEINHLQSCLNAAVFDSAQSWMLPAWAIKKQASGSKSSGDSSSFANDVHRNWVTIGEVGGQSFAIVDETGLLTANREFGSIDFWLEDNEAILHPSLTDRDGPRLGLFSPDDQLYEWNAILNAVEFTRQIYYSTSAEHEAIYNEILVKNHSLEDVEFIFYVAIRPISVLGVEPIEHIDYDSKERKLYVNGFLALTADKPPESVILDTANNPNLPTTIRNASNRLDTEFKSAKGLSIAIMRYKVKLTPAGSQRLFFINPISKIEMNNEAQFNFKPAVRDEYVGKWFDFSVTTTKFSFPEPVLNSAAMQAKAILALQAKSKIASGLESVSSTEWREWARILSAISKSGCLDLARDLTLQITQDRGSSGAELEPIDASPLLWGVLQYTTHSQEKSFLPSITPTLDQLLTIITTSVESQLNEPEPQALPAELSDEPDPDSPYLSEGDAGSDEFLGVDEILAASAEIRGEPASMEVAEPPKATVWNLPALIESLWNLGALRAAELTLQMQELGTRAESIRALRSAYTQLVLEHSKKMLDLHGSENNSVNALHALDLLATVSLLGKDGTDEFLLDWTLAFVTDNLVKRNLVRVPEPDARFSSHLSLRIAHYHALGKSDYETWTLLRRVIELLSEFHTLPDFVEPRSGAGSSGSGSSILAAADLLLILREMVVYEDGPDIIVLPAIPDEWFTSSVPLQVSGLPLSTGVIDVEVGTSRNQHQIEVKMSNLPNELEIHVPTYFSLPMIKLFGGGIINRVKEEGIAYIRAVPMSTNVVATFHR